MIQCSTDTYQQALPTALSLGHQCLASCGWTHGPGALSSSLVVLVMPSVQSQWFLLIQTLILQPSHSNLPSSETKWNGCRCDSRVHHIICWIQTLTLNLSLLIVTPGDPRFQRSHLPWAFHFGAVSPKSLYYPSPSVSFGPYKVMKPAPVPEASCLLPILWSSASTESSHDPNLSVLPDLTYDPNTYFSLSAIVFPLPNTNPNPHPSHGSYI